MTAQAWFWLGGILLGGGAAFLAATQYLLWRWYKNFKQE